MLETERDKFEAALQLTGWHCYINTSMIAWILWLVCVFFQAWWKFAAAPEVVHSRCRIRPYSDVRRWGAAVYEALYWGSEPAGAADWPACLSAWIPWSMVRSACIEPRFPSQAADTGDALCSYSFSPIIWWLWAHSVLAVIYLRVASWAKIIVIDTRSSTVINTLGNMENLHLLVRKQGIKWYRVKPKRQWMDGIKQWIGEDYLKLKEDGRQQEVWSHCTMNICCSNRRGWPVNKLMNAIRHCSWDLSQLADIPYLLLGVVHTPPLHVAFPQYCSRFNIPNKYRYVSSYKCSLLNCGLSTFVKNTCNKRTWSITVVKIVKDVK